MSPSEWPLSALPEGWQNKILMTLNSGQWVNGNACRAFEQEFKSEVRAQHAVAVSNCTHAIQAALLAHGVRPGQVVGVPALSFSGSVLGIISMGAIPRFIDVDPITMNMANYDLLDEAEDLDAIVPVHMHGRAFDVVTAHQVLGRNFKIIEDACQAHTARFKDGKRVGSRGTACFSTSQAKMIAAPGGAIVTTDDPTVGYHLKSLTNYGDDPEAPFRDQVVKHAYGSNWRMTEVDAVLAWLQVPLLEERHRAGVASADILLSALRPLEERGLLQLPVEIDFPTAYHAWHKFRVVFKSETNRRTRFAEAKAENVPVSIYQHQALSDMPGFSNWQRDCPIARRIVANSLIVGTERHPLHNWTEGEALRYAEQLSSVWR